MKILKKWLIMSVLFLGIIGVNAAHADETDLFATVPPDAFILLDLSGSMNWLAMETDNIDYKTLLFWIPSTELCDNTLYTGAYYTSYQAGVATKPCATFTIRIPNASSCTDYYGPVRDSNLTGWKSCANSDIGADTGVIPWGDAACLGPFYRSSGTGHDVSCKKADIAKRALGDLLDDNNDGAITVNDITSLKVRLGFGSYYNNVYTLRWDISKSGDTVNYPLGPEARYDNMAPYSRIFCNNATTCSPLPPYATSSTASIRTSPYTGGTPLGSSMGQVKTYLDTHRDGIDLPYKTCRQKYVIIITDGSDTSSNPGCTSPLQRRRHVANQAKMLKDAGYLTFVVGLGANMPAQFTNTLEWMAYLGGTDNPSVPNCIPADACSTTAFDPALATCAADATGNDPGTIKLTGRAFLASNASQLTAALKTALNMINEGTYSFSAAPAVSAIRDSSENFLYEASFLPKNEEPFWKGNLKKYQINADGSVGTLLWNAGAVLQGRADSSRSMWTSKVASGAATAFTMGNISAADLNVATTAIRDSVVGFYRGEPTYNIENWKLGDVFRSTPIVVGTPASYFYDPRQNGATSFAAFRTANIRTSASGNEKRIVLVGANDGQLHAFKTSDGSEAWSFIPPNLLNKLASIVHNVHPTALGHQFFVDGQSQVADVWTGTGTGGSKVQSEWKTLAIFSLGRTGAGNNLWSSSASCYSTSASAFSDTWSATNNQYCGYHALDITSTTLSAPAYYWHIKNLAADQGPYLGVPMGNKMQIGRIKDGTSEKWVGFIGGGYESTECSGSCTTSTNKKGKGFYVVDLTDGSILWKYTNADNSSMSFSISATPLALDLDNDGFIDTVYVGDLGGNMWRFRLCAKYDSAGNPVPSSCSTSSWTASMLYQAGSLERPKYIFTQAAHARDSLENIWVYFGTGNKIDPVSATGTNRFFAVKENIGFTGTHTTANLENISSSVYTDSTTKHGWYFNLTAPGEKIIADIKVFNANIYFTTYLPYTGTGDACLAAGTSSLYGINYLTGVGTISGNTTDTSRSIYAGVGIASTPVISLSPDGSGANLYVTTSGGGGIAASSEKKKDPPMPATSTNILYWKDRRIQ